MEALLECMHVACTRFCTLGADLHAQSVLSSKISASELSRKSIKGALLVGQQQQLQKSHNNPFPPFLLLFFPLSPLGTISEIFPVAFFVTNSALPLFLPPSLFPVAAIIGGRRERERERERVERKMGHKSFSLSLSLSHWHTFILTLTAYITISPPPPPLLPPWLSRGGKGRRKGGFIKSILSSSLSLSLSVSPCKSLFRTYPRT